MKSRPILFSGAMVRALLDGRKTQTRRIVKPQPSGRHNWRGWVVESTDRKHEGCASWGIDDGALMRDSVYSRCPHGQPGDLLWVRETFGCQVREYGGGTGEYLAYRADNPDAIYCESACGKKLPIKWKPSIHMPRWVSRITLEITGVRVERLQDINEEDAKEEGAAKLCFDGESFLEDDIHGSHRCGFAGIWAHINGSESWDGNPWVWALEFKVHQINVDKLIEQREVA